MIYTQQFLKSCSKHSHFVINCSKLLSPVRHPSSCFNTKFIITRLVHNGEGLPWNLSAKDIATKTDELIQQTQETIDQLSIIKPESVTYENFIKPLADMSTKFSVVSNNLDFYQNVHPDKDRRDASTEADKKLSAFGVQISMKKEIFDRVLAFQSLPSNKLGDEGKRFLERTIKNGKRNGLNLEENLRKKIEDIKKQSSELGITFQKNLTEVNTVLHFAKGQLPGMSEEFLESLEKNDEGEYGVTLQYPHVFPILQKCKDAATRKKVSDAFGSRCKEDNSIILQKLVDLRREKATILGYDTHAAFIQEMRMAEKPSNVKSFLSNIADKMQPLGKSDLELMRQMKKKECEQSNIDYDGKINMWDLKYFSTQIEEEKYKVDQNKLKEYFPMETVTKGLLDIYEHLLSLKYEKVENAATWHEDVMLYKVIDNATTNVIGHFYLDLYPRKGKYGHAACFGLIPGCLKADGTRQTAVAAMVSNFTKPTPTSPSLLLHDEVVTYFHEFGHVMHQICAEANYSMFAGTAVERDFVEAPSQMLENWCWEIEPLKQMSGHYKTKESLPMDMMTSLIKSRHANTGVFYLRQISLASLDLELHTMKTTPDVAKVYDEACKKYLGIPASEGTCMPASFGHLAGGYDAQYYGYMWAEVSCFDMFYSRFKKEGIMNPEVGLDYRRKILKPGGSIDANDMLKNFLGREPKQDAFLNFVLQKNEV